MKKLILPIVLLLVLAGIFGYQKYRDIFEPNVPDVLSNQILEVPPGTDYNGLVKLMVDQKILISETSFLWVAEQMKFSTVRPGRFKIGTGWNNRRLINHLKAGRQETVKLVFNTGRKLEDIAGKASKFLETDSSTLIAAMLNPEIHTKYGYKKEDFISMFIPNTYDFYWITEAEDFIERMAKEHDKFWSSNGRKQKAAKLEMTPEEVYSPVSYTHLTLPTICSV